MAVAAGTLRDSCPHRRQRQGLARCDREAQALAGLNHPHIARVYGIVHERDVTHYDREVSEADADLTRGGIAGAALGVLSIGPLLYLLGQKRRLVSLIAGWREVKTPSPLRRRRDDSGELGVWRTSCHGDSGRVRQASRSAR